MRRYYEPEQDLLPPVKLEPCITAHGDQVYLQEPLVADCICHVSPPRLACVDESSKALSVAFQAHLVSCTVHCLTWLQNTHQTANLNADDSDDEENDEGYKSELQTILESMTRRMIKCELEDFELVLNGELFFPL